MARTIHRGAGRGSTPQESRHAGAMRAAATKARLQALYRTHPRKVVDAGWKLVKGKKASTREAWFLMLEAGFQNDRQYARALQIMLMDDLGIEEPEGYAWSDDDWAGLWY